MRLWPLALLAIGLVIVAATSSLELLWYVAYLVLVGGFVMWMIARNALAGLSLRRTVDRAYAHVGERIQVDYEVRNGHRLPKSWIEVGEESSWPELLPGRVVSIPAGGRKTWSVSVPARRRGRFRIGPTVVRSGDPFGIFPVEGRLPGEASVIVYPAISPLPSWQLPGAFLEGGLLTGRRSHQTTSMVMGLREYRTGDAVNRIHWPSSQRLRGLQVKEFELDKTADLWIALDLDRHWHRGEGERSTEERCVTVTASLAAKAIREQRNVGLIVSGAHVEVLQPDRGDKQFGKLMRFLAEVRADGSRGFAEVLIETMQRLRRGAAAVLITPSLDRAWVRPAGALRERAVATQAVVVAGPYDIGEHDRARRFALFGELAVAGIAAAPLGADDPVATLFRTHAGSTA